MNYSEIQKMYKNKFKDYTVLQCNHAINDIDETLALHRDKDMNNSYIIKLFCERDEVISRKYFLQKV